MRLKTDVNVNEGTLSFWVKKDKQIWNDGKITPFFNYTGSNGTLSLIKDDDNKLKFSQILMGEGRVDIEADVSDLPSDKKHFIAVTWSRDKKKTRLYLDGEVKVTAETE